MKKHRFTMADHVQLANDLANAREILMNAFCRLSPCYPKNASHVQIMKKSLRLIDSVRSRCEDAMFAENPGLPDSATQIYYNASGRKQKIEEFINN